MAETCAKFARSLSGVEHITTKVPWSTPPFPKRPIPGVEAFENTARLARYEMLFRSMRSIPLASGDAANVIAFGHHADDQVETSLMRFGRGTTELGGGGMRYCRRWGMGLREKKDGEDCLGWSGYEGMNKWIVRPLLEVSKDRILATCDENKLEYVTDKSNFQPHITIRNAIRRVLNAGRDLQDVESAFEEPLPDTIKEQLSNIDHAISSLRSVSVDLTSGVDQLRSAVAHLTSQVEDIDSQVDSHLKRCRIPSPTGTFLMSCRGLASIKGDLVRQAFALRIMRYVSFHPWGSIRADGNRRRAIYKQIIDKLWVPDPFAAHIKMFVAGAGVLWIPVLVRGSHIKTPDRLASSGMEPGEVIGWLATRQPPLHKRRMDTLEMYNPLRIDVTDALRQRLNSQSVDSADSTLEVMYDCRFVVRFDLAKMPRNLATEIMEPLKQTEVNIIPHTRWYWPQVVHLKSDEQNVLHSDIATGNREIFPFVKADEEPDDHELYWKRRDKPVVSDWIHVKWIRPLTAI
ncbi:hypothetical protein AX17_002891 [Amanita inopinata Kibby_2008]|nr:hypothetical protein AX17_002891 [Amanita inopinata Kibby_2008]